MRIGNLRRLVLPLVLWVIILSNGSMELSARNRVVLSAAKPISSQIRPSDTGAIYVVSDNIDLKKKSVKLPQDAILQFEGGALSNGELSGNNATIEAGKYVIFKDVVLSGSWTLDGIPIEWFGAVPNRSSLDCAIAINFAINTGRRIGAPALLGAGIYYTKSTIVISDYGALIGLSPTHSSICYSERCDVGVFMRGQYTTLRNICVQESKKERKGICIKVGDLDTRTASTRGYVEDVVAMGGNRGVDLEYQWCHKISGVSCKYNNIGLYAHSTTPYIENAVIERNYQYGVYSEGFGIKLYNAIIEGNKVGCVLNGRDNLLNNCYFEGNSASLCENNPAKDKNGVDVEGGHLFVGEQSTVNSLVMISCLIDSSRKYNNSVRVDKCNSFSAIGCNSLKDLNLTKNCTVSILDASHEMQ